MKGTAAILLVLLLDIMFSCKKNVAQTPFVPSTITYTNSLSISEDDPNLYAQISVNLTFKSDSTVVIDYITEDSSAISGTDYIGTANGKITFKPGEISKTISVPIIANKAQKKDVVFFVDLTRASNATLAPGKVRVKIKNVDYATLVWSDEFNAANLNTADWNYELGNNGGWGNNEKEVYTNSTNNVFLSGGYLNIKAIKEADGSYTSGRITTNGKQQFTHCKVDILAKLPQGQGIWPALWMLGSNIGTIGWPKCGEMDMMEVLGHQTNKTYGTIHWDNNGHQQSGGNYSLPTGSFSSDFHLFTYIWTSNKITWLVDNIEYYTVVKSSAINFPIDLPEFFIFNVAVGGSWPGNPDGTTVFPQTMQVDYIKVYQ